MSCQPILRADEASKTAKAQELLGLMQGDQMMKMVEPMMKRMLAQVDRPDLSAEQRAKLAETKEKVLALIGDRLNRATPALAKVYTDTYTEDEIEGVLAFYKSAVGKAFLEKMPQVMQRSVPVMMELMGSLQPEIQKITEEVKQISK